MRKWIVRAVAVLVVVVALLVLRRFLPLARIGAGYAAEQTCACLFVSGRTLESCRGDLDPLALEIVSLHVGSDDVRASVAGLMPARAQFSTATGCALVK
jgi:hypothetical protein